MPNQLTVLEAKVAAYNMFLLVGVHECICACQSYMQIIFQIPSSPLVDIGPSTKS